MQRKGRLRNVDTIINDCSALFHIAVDRIRGTERDKFTVQARNAVYYVARKELGMSYTEIGQRFGGRDHTGVRHGVHKLEDQMGASPALASKIAFVRTLLNGMQPLNSAAIEPFVVQPKPKKKPRRDLTEDEYIDLTDEEHAEMMQEGSRNLLLAIVGSMAA